MKKQILGRYSTFTEAPNIGLEIVLHTNIDLALVQAIKQTIISLTNLPVVLNKYRSCFDAHTKAQNMNGTM